MKARIPDEAQFTKKQLKQIDELAKKRTTEYSENVQFIFYFCSLLALNDCAGWGTTRCKRYCEAMEKILTELNKYIDEGLEDIIVDKLIRAMRSRNLDFEEILDINVVKVPDEYYGRWKNDA